MIHNLQLIICSIQFFCVPIGWLYLSTSKMADSVYNGKIYEYLVK